MKISKLFVAILMIISLTSICLFQALAIEPDLYSDRDNSINKAIKYLHSIQNDDGGFPSKEGRDSSTSITCWVIMALTAAGEDVEDSYWKPVGNGPLDYINNTDNKVEETTEYARLLLTLSATESGTLYRGEDLADRIVSFQQNDGQFSQLDKGEDSMINAHMWSILALASAGREIPNKQKAKEWLISSQNNDGGFSWVVGGESDSDDTAIAIQTLVILGENPKTSMPIINGLKYIKSHQQKDGGFSSSKLMGNESNCASDSWVLQGLIASGEDPLSNKWSTNDENIISHLTILQNVEGAYNWKDGLSSSTVTMTAYALMGLCNKPFPINIDYSEFIYEDLFNDFNNTHWAYASVLELVNNDIIHGYPDGNFKPEGLVTRAEFTNMIVSGLNLIDYECKKELKFIDVPKELWAYKSISKAFSNGIVNGRSNEVFDPNGKITGAELATMLINSLPDDKKRNIEKGEYWYSGNVKLAENYNLLYPNFDPIAYATRAQCAYSINKIRGTEE